VGRLDGKKVLILVGQRYYDEEATGPVDLLVEAGAGVDVASFEKGTLKGVKGRAMLGVEFSLDEVDPARYDALVIPGGDSPSNLKEHTRAIEIVKAFSEADKPIAAIGEGPRLLAAAGVLEGKAVTGSHKIKREMERAGAKFVDEPVWVGGGLITARGYTEISRFVMAIEAALD
jgi:PfpI family intracellular protease